MRALALALPVALAPACSREPPPVAVPCPTWTVLETGACRARAWRLPAPEDGIGEAGAKLRGVAIDGVGLGLAAWEEALPGRLAVGVGEELSPGVWAVRDPAAALAGADAAPAVAGGPDGAAVVTWVHAETSVAGATGREPGARVPGSIAGVVTAERDAWGRWTDPRPGEARSFPPSAVEPWVAAAPTGEWILAWCQATRTGWGVAVAHREAMAASWQRPGGADDVVSPPILFANQPLIAVNARGDALVAWYQSEGVPLMTYVSERRGPRGAFSRPGARDHVSPMGAPVASDPVHNPKPALGPRGEAAVVWVQENGAGATPVYLATRDAAGAWNRPRDLADAFSAPAGVARDAHAAFGPRGELFVVWAQEGAIHAARRDAGGRWTSSGRAPVRLSTPGRLAYAPTLAVGPEGGAIAAWVETWGPRDERVAARRTGEDRPAWEAIEWLSGPRTPAAGPPLAAMGPGDRTLVGWAAGSPRDARIVVARVE